MSETMLKKTGCGPCSQPDSKPEIEDPTLLKEWESLEDPKDRADLLEAIEALKEVEREGTVSWEEIKAELGL